MQFFALTLGFCAIAAVSAVPAVVNTGHSAQFRKQDSLGNYAFGYNEDHATGGTFRRESGSPGIAEGSYGLRDIDGRVRVVNYVADGLGFRANVQTNEPGVDPSQDPASVLINKAAAIVAPYISEEPIVQAPLAIQQSYEAPIVQKYEAGPAVIDAAPIVQRYESAPIIEQAPIVQKYEPAPYIEQAPIVQKYESAPYLEQAPIVQKYEAGPALINAAPLVSSYTTKTYAAPAPILSAPVAHGPISAAYGPGPAAYAEGPAAYGPGPAAYGPGPAAYGPGPVEAYGPGPVAAYGPGPVGYATKGAAPIGVSSAVLGLKGLASPAFAAKSLGAYGVGPLIKKK